MSLRDWQKVVGSFKISELTTKDTILKHLTEGTKYLECVTNGNIITPTTQAFGTWEFDIFRPSGNIEIELSGDALNRYSDSVGTRYWFLFYSDGKTYFVKKVAGGPTILLATAANYMVINTWYSIRITRTIQGVFTLWVKGGAFGDTWTLISVSGGSGNNPTAADLTLTKSIGMSLSLSAAGCRVANLKFYDGVKQ
jgi:hypothetical protein